MRDFTWRSLLPSCIRGQLANRKQRREGETHVIETSYAKMHKAVADSQQASLDVKDAVARRQTATDPLRKVIGDLLARLDR